MATPRRSITRRWRAALANRLLPATLACAALTPAAAGAAPFAKQLDAQNVETLRPGGPDADAGVGDWVLGNGTLCAAIADGAHETHLGPHGGSLIDLAPCGAGGDQWSTLHPILAFGKDWALPVREVRAEEAPDEARIVAVAEGDGLRLTTVHAIGPAPSRELRVLATLERIGEGPRLFSAGSVVLHSGAQLRPFMISRAQPEASPGFARPAADPSSPFSLLRALAPADAHVLVGGDHVEPGLAYGIRVETPVHVAESGERNPVGRLAVGGYDFTLLGIASRPYWFFADDAEPPGILQLIQLPFMDLYPGERLESELVISLGDRADVASVTDGFFDGAPTVRGRVDDPASRLHVLAATASSGEPGAPVTVVRPDADGRVAFRLPTGAYRVRTVAPGGRTVDTDLDVDETGGDLGLVRVGAPALLRLPRGETMRLVFRGQGDTPDPRFGDDLLGFRVGERTYPSGALSSSISLAGVTSDPEHVTIAPGQYRVLATRGLEYGVTEAALRIAPGEEQTLSIAPPARVLETPGWIGADLHVHTGQSFDSSWPAREQLRAFAAQGVEVVVTTEHDRVFDPAPTVGALGLTGRMAGISGVEITSSYAGGESPHTIGHSNAFPFAERPTAYRRGAPLAEGLRLRDVAYGLRRLDPRPVFQLNHPRANSGGDGELYYFSHLAVSGDGFDPARPLTALPNRALLEADPAHGLRDIDFDAIELLNGTETGRYRLLRADWTSLLLQGERRTATANSDSHQASELPGLPRNLVRLASDDPGAFDGAAFARSVLAGGVVGTSGPVLEVALEGAGIGDTHRGAEGTLQVRVRAAPWVPLREVRVLVDGDVVTREPVGGDAELSVPLQFAQDGFVVVEAEGPAEGTYAELLPGLVPLAFTNPIWVDADSDGRWTPPGLPSPLPWALTSGLETPQ